MGTGRFGGFCAAYQNVAPGLGREVFTSLLFVAKRVMVWVVEVGGKVANSHVSELELPHQPDLQSKQNQRGKARIAKTGPSCFRTGLWHNWGVRFGPASWFFLVISATAAAQVANSSLRLPAELPPSEYGLANAFPGLHLESPLGVAAPPGEMNQLFILERAGTLVAVTNLCAPTRTVILHLDHVPTDGENGLLGLAFHPGFATNGFFFLYYSFDEGKGLFQRLSRFQIHDLKHELVLLNQADRVNTHNGGQLQFGPDGYLYVAVGDEGCCNDQFDNSRFIDRGFFSGILRLDVDKRPGSLPPNPHPAASTNYAIPPDNPFIGLTNFNGQAVEPKRVRTEFWAVGLRNPWRFDFDPETKELICADVGQDAWEEIDVIERGGNYGWPYYEGRFPGPRAAPAGFVQREPLLEYSHGPAPNQGFCIIGGVVYRGSRLPNLRGAYVFADYVTGRIWALRHEGRKLTAWQQIQSMPNIVSFGRDPGNGDVLLTHLAGNTIYRLVSANATPSQPLPPTLAETGAFRDVRALTPADALVAYDLNVPFWSDNAAKTRWFVRPSSGEKIGFSDTNNWALPAGMVWVKHFELELTNGVPASRRRLETRFLVRSTNGVYGITYRWNAAQDNATLVGPDGLDESFTISEQGTNRVQVWHYPGRSECLVCHTPGGGFALGFNTAQLNRGAQLAAWAAAGYFSNQPPPSAALPALAPMAATNAPIEVRARSYLAANCAGCHQPNGPSGMDWDARFLTPTAQSKLINAPPKHPLGNPNLRLVAPGKAGDSILVTRVSTNAPLRMPPLGSNLLDRDAIELMTEWINRLPRQ